MPIQEVKKTNEQHAVPQNIMDVEFKLIGDLTMRQFVYILVFAGLAYIFYLVVPHPFKYLFSTVSALLGIGLAFVPLQERGLDQWIMNFFHSVYSPTQRVWHKEVVLPTAFGYQNLAMVHQELITLAPTSSRRRLEEYLEVQDSTQVIDVLDIPEQEFANKIREAFGDVANMPSVTAKTAITQVPAIADKKKITKAVPAKVASTEKKPVPPKSKEIPQKIVPKVQPKAGHAPAKAPPVSLHVPKTKLDIIKSRLGGRMKSSGRSISSPLTPDRHSGRVFTNLAPGQGQLILPIRRERVLKTSEELAVDETMREKAKQLRQLISQAKEVKEHRNNVVKSVVLSEDKPLESAKKPQKDRRNMSSSFEREKALGDSDKLAVKAPPKSTFKSATSSNPKPVVSSKTVEGNIIKGVIKNNLGNIMEGVVVLIKNVRGEPVRALKTNALGAFAISNALSNGSYSVEVDSTKKTEVTFDIISVELRGGPLDPLEIQGHN